MVIVNVGVVLIVVGVGAAYVDPANWHPFLHKDTGYHGIALGAARIFIAYVGFDSISTHAEEARKPQRDLALGIIGALATCTVLYVATAAVLTGMMPYSEINEAAPLAAALQSKGLSFAGTLVTLGILAGMTSSLLVGNLSQPRILLAMARDGLLPLSFFGSIRPRFKTPWKSTILVGVVVAVGGALALLRLSSRPGEHRHAVRVCASSRPRSGFSGPLIRTCPVRSASSSFRSSPFLGSWSTAG